jgi:hypothetical protein
MSDVNAGEGTRAIPKWDWSGGGTFGIGTGGEEFVGTRIVSEETNGAPNWHNSQIYMRLRRRFLPFG